MGRTVSMRQFTLSMVDDAWSVVCQKMELAVRSGNYERAKGLLDEYILQHHCQDAVTMDSSVHDLGLSPRLASILQEGGFLTVRAVVLSTDLQLLTCRQLSYKSVMDIRQRLKELGL